MELNTQKEEFSDAYIQAIASASGYAFQRATTPLDQVGIDATITGIGAQGSMGFPQLYVQVKCTSRDVLEENRIRYPLKIKNYEELRNNYQYPPLILVVVLVSENVNEWLRQSEEELCLRRCGYWVSLRGEPETRNKETVTVYLPRKNVFTANALKTLMQGIGTGEIL
ncbi:MAG: DUF4365 domain-containing protein [Cyanobacteriota bacterium]